MPSTGKSVEYISLGELGDSSEIRLAKLTVVGKRPGKCLWVQGAVHGDELNCVKIALELYKRTDPDKLSGTLVTLPVANPTAFQQFKRVSPVDDLDVNREYPGNASGFLTQRTAKLLLDKALGSATVILDLHTGGTYGYCPPYVIFQAGGPSAKLAREVALNFGTEIVIELPAGSTPGRLSAVGAEKGIPSLTLEGGGGTALQHDMVELGVKGAMNVMITLGMMDGRLDVPAEQVIYTKRDWVRATRGGICSLAVSPGQEVRKGQPVATIENLSAEIVEELFAPFDGRITLLRVFPAVRTGDWIALVADAGSATVARRDRV